jgi:hypothetical protein
LDSPGGVVFEKDLGAMTADVVEALGVVSHIATADAVTHRHWNAGAKFETAPGLSGGGFDIKLNEKFALRLVQGEL